jgi:hypothetical protein
MSSNHSVTDENAPKRRRKRIWLTREVVARLAVSAHVSAPDAGEPHTVGLRTLPPCVVERVPELT